MSLDYHTADYRAEQAGSPDAGSGPEITMIDTRTAPYAAFLLRVVLGILFLAHAGLKLFVFTPAGTAKFFASLGLPAELAYLTMTLEIVGAVMLILGLWTRWAALALVPVLVGAIVTVHGSAGFFFSNPKGGWEYPAFWAVALIAQALLGDGAFALRPSARVARPALALN